MYEIHFYENKNGISEVKEFIKDLNIKAKTDKNSKVNLHKIIAYLDVLEEIGTRAGAPVTKHLEDGIWELRPLKNRILYAHYKDNKFIILHHFIKKTRKTPKKEIKKALSNLKDFTERNEKL